MTNENPTPPADPTPQRLNPSQPSTPAAAPGETPPPKPPRRKRRRWLKVIGIVVIVLILLLIALPTIVSMGWVKNIIVGQVNERINGRVQINDWSLGWFGGIRLDGVRLWDAHDVQIAELENVTTGLSVWDILCGNYSAGKVVIRGLDFNVWRDADGNLNIEKLAKTSSPSPASGGTSTPVVSRNVSPPPSSSTSSSAELPNFSGDLQLIDCHGTYTDKQAGQFVKMTSITGQINIPGINQPIKNNLEVVAGAGTFEPGKLKLDGVISAIQNRRVLDLDQMDLNETVSLRDLDLGILQPLLARTVTQLAGMTTGDVAIRLKPHENALVTGALNVRNTRLSAVQFKGDIFVAPTASLTLSKLSVAMGRNGDKVALGRILAGSSENPIVLTFTNVPGAAASKVAVYADVTGDILQRMANSQAPGGTGAVGINADVNLAPLANSMPHLLNLLPDVKLDSAEYRQQVSLAIRPTDVQIHQSLTLSNVQGRNTETGGAIAIQPIGLSVSATSRGGNGKIPDLRDISLDLTSSFANAELHAANLGDLHGKFDAALDKLQKEAGQIYDFKGTQLAGTLNASVQSTGDLVSAGTSQPAQTPSAFVNASLTLTGLKVNRPGEPALDVASTVVKASAHLDGGPKSFISALRGFDVTAQAGDGKTPTLDSQMLGTLRFVAQPGIDPVTGKSESGTKVKVEQFKLARLNLDAVRAQQQFGALIPYLHDHHLNIRQGQVVASANYDGQKFEGMFGVNKLSIDRTSDSGGTSVPVMNDYTLTANTTGQSARDSAATALNLSNLNISDNQGMFSIKNGGAQPLKIALTSGHMVVPTGTLQLDANLVKINTLRQAISGSNGGTADTGAQDTQLRGGHIGGTLAFAAAAESQIQLDGNLQVTGLNVDRAGQPIVRDQTIGIVLLAKASSDFSSLGVPKLDVNGSLLSAQVRDLMVQLAQGPDARPITSLLMLRSGKITVNVPSLPMAQAILDAFKPAHSSPVASALPLADPALALAQANEPPVHRGRRTDAAPVLNAPAPVPAAADGSELPPLQLTSGSAVVSVDISNDGRALSLSPHVSAKNISFNRGAASANVGVVDVTSALSIVPVAAEPASTTTQPSTQPSLAEQIAEVQVARFDVDAAGSKISLKQPLILKNLAQLADMFSPASGAAGRAAVLSASIHAQGGVAKLMNLARAMQGSPPSGITGGSYSLDQLLSISNGVLTAKGLAQIADLAVASADGAAFSEHAIVLNNDVVLDATKHSAQLNDVSMDMQSSKALTLKVSGTIDDVGTLNTMQKVHVNLGYDAAALWKLIYPLLPREKQESLKDVKVAGVFQRQILLGGRYWTIDPTTHKSVPFNQAIAHVIALGAVALDSFDGKGASIRKLEIPFVLRNGQFRIVDPDKPEGQNLSQPAQLNGGTLALGGASIDLTSPHLDTTMPKGTKLLHNVSLNPIFASTFLGGYLNNPMFHQVSDSSGQLDVTINEMTRLPLDKTVTEPVDSNKGRLDVNLAVSDCHVGNDMVVKILGFLQASQVGKSLQGEIKSYHVVIEHGVVTQDLTFTYGEQKRPLNLSGTVQMQDQAMNMALKVPTTDLKISHDFEKYMKEIVIPIGGTVSRPVLDPQAAIQKNLMQNAPKNILDQFLRGAGGKSAANTGQADTNPAGGANNNDNPLSGLENLLGGKHKEKPPKRKKRPATQPAD